MKFSVIIPVYNAAAVLDECVNSVLCQTHTDIEVILVDDGSCDGSAELCDSLAASDPRIRVIHQTNAGTSQARNTGLEAATGDYVMFLDNDDYWMSEHGLSNVAHHLDQSHADVLLFDSTIDRGQGSSVKTSALSREKIEARRPEVALRELISRRKLTSAVWTKAVKTSLIRENGLRFPKGMRNEDTYFTGELIRFARSYDWYDEYFYAYRKGTGTSQTAKRNTYAVVQDLEMILRQMLPLADQITDEGLRFCYLSYLAYPYTVWLGQARADGSIQAKRDLASMKQYEWVLRFDLDPWVHAIHILDRVLGYRLLSWILGLAMHWIYRRQGATR